MFIIDALKGTQSIVGILDKVSAARRQQWETAQQVTVSATPVAIVWTNPGYNELPLQVFVTNDSRIPLEDVTAVARIHVTEPANRQAFSFLEFSLSFDPVPKRDSRVESFRVGIETSAAGAPGHQIEGVAQFRQGNRWWTVDHEGRLLPGKQLQR